jgi:putative membrane-bound dehydrogenase-like protein
MRHCALCWRRMCLAAVLLLAATADSRAELRCGLARVDATPAAPLRLSGYGNRAVPSEGTDVPLYVRALALQAESGPVHVLLSVDSIGFPASLTQEVLTRLERDHGLSQARLALCATHSHTTPHLQRGLDNLFSTPLTDAERAAATTYTDALRDHCVEAAVAAMQALAPARLFVLEGQATFARNRRVLKDGVWTGFGENSDGPVDHRLPVLAITGLDGQAVRGLVFNYACHCTTFGGDYNRVNGDWAGYAAEYLEAAHPGCVALCAIGCGADQNPERDAKRALDIAQAQGRQIADETDRLLAQGVKLEITATPQASYGFAGLPIDRPSVDDLNKALEDKRPQVQRHAQVMLDTKERMGRLPETYPMPIQVWRFGDQFAMVFLGGEVCVDYAHRIRKELEPQLAANDGAAGTPSRVWVAAYANDVFGYVASERMRPAGGYEVDFSMIYYLQPGRWSAGTEDVILRRVHELFESQGGGEPLSVNDALRTFKLPDEFEIDVVAAEPLVTDPVNFAVDAAGKLWVVEMGDYPRGVPDANGWSPPLSTTGSPWAGPPGGRVRVLTDTDGDGRYDEAVTFLDGLTFPTGVFPWRDGAIISGAPDLLFTRDDDGDGRADHREVLYTGFDEDNPQHRVNGFEYGLDGWLYLASGVSNFEITCVRTGEKVDISGRDLRIHPDTNRLEAVSGRSQYGRCRDDFGNWFGNTNSEPAFQYVIEDRDLRRNPSVVSPSPRAMLTARPAVVYPTSRTVDRFNDLLAADRFTSACGPQIFRDDALGADAAASIFFCEPVHNLVSRVQLDRSGPQFTGRRFPAEQMAEFLSSTDPWFRPVRLGTGPDGSLWVCDMYRMVIEHPQWIPEAWQARLNLSAGHDRGRIYRVRRKDSPQTSLPNLASLTNEELVAELASPNGWRRDTAQRLLLDRPAPVDEALIAALRHQAHKHPEAKARTQSLWTLNALWSETKNDELLRESFLRSDNPDLVIQGLRVFTVAHGPQLKWQPTELRSHADPRVRYELALAAGNADDATIRTNLLAALAARDDADAWMRAAILSSATGVATDVLGVVLRDRAASAERDALVDGLIATSLGDDPEHGAAAVLAVIAPRDGESVEGWQRTSLATCLDALSRRKQSLATLASGADATLKATLARIDTLLSASTEIAADEAAPLETRTASIRLLGRREDDVAADSDVLHRLLAPVHPPEIQLAATERLADLNDAMALLAALRRVSPGIQAAIESALLQRKPLTQALLKAVRDGEVEPNRLAAATRSALLNHRDMAIRDAARQSLGAVAAQSSAVVAQRIAQVSPLRGDSAHGQTLFEKRCSTCHRHRGIGVEVGPQLAALQNKSTDFLLTAILDANRSVEPRYRSCSLLLTDGRQQVGLVADETATSLTLVTADGRKHPVLRRDIEELTLTGLSFMPEGLDKDLADQDLSDLIAFLQQAE